jgi:ABC-type multidrug transport system fused ATPase/permease subunit
MDISTLEEEEKLGKTLDLKLLWRFLGYLKPYKGFALFVFFLMFVKIGMDLVGPLILKESIDGPVANKDYKGLVIYALLFVGSIILLGIFEFLNVYCRNLLGQKVIMDLRLQLFSHIVKLPISFYDKNPVGRLVVRVTNDLENMIELFTSGLVAFIFDILLLVGILIVMFAINTQLTLVVLTVSPLAAVGIAVFRKTTRDVWRELRRKTAKLNAYLNENIMGMKIVQVFNREEKNLQKFTELNFDYRKSGIRAGLIYSAFWPCLDLMTALVTAMLLWYGGASILKGTLTFGAFLAFWYCLQKFMMPLVDFAEKINILQSGMAASERVFKLLDTLAEDIDIVKHQEVGRFKGDIEFQNVTFSYDGENNVLENVSFRIERGESTAVVGLTGAGKTTLVNLLLRLYEIKSGRILIDEKDIREYELYQLRRNIAIVPQDLFLFSGSIEENIKLGEEVSTDKIWEVARYVNADRFIFRKPAGLSTDVKERGVALSYGERQLLAFARALAFDPSILILDEATSAVDSETEFLIQQAIKNLLKKRTSIVIAHRLSTIQAVDKIIVLHKGKIVEEGSHEDLISKQGVYSRLYKLQYTDFHVTL